MRGIRMHSRLHSTRFDCIATGDCVCRIVYSVVYSNLSRESVKGCACSRYEVLGCILLESRECARVRKCASFISTRLAGKWFAALKTLSFHTFHRQALDPNAFVQSIPILARKLTRGSLYYIIESPYITILFDCRRVRASTI